MLQLRFVPRSRLLACLVLTLGFACSAESNNGGADDPEGEKDTLGEDGSGGSTNTPGPESGSQTGTGGEGAASGGEGTGASSAGTGATDSGTGGTAEAPLEECAAPSIDRLREWLASGEGPTTPATGSLLTPEGDGYVARASFTSGSEWHVLAIWLGNEFGASMDLSASSGFTLTYSATADFYFQLRPAAQWSGGDKWHMAIPATAGEVVTTFFPFEASAWVERLGTPPHTLDQALADASGFAVVGNSQNELSFHGLRIDGFSPDCKEP